MRSLVRRILAVALLAPFAAAATPDPAFQPVAFLVGHCWKGTLPGGKATDEHCYSWIYDGKFVRDRHVVREGEKIAYQGESIYYKSPATSQVEYMYFTAAGGYSQGRMQPEGDALVFPEAVMHTGGKTIAFRSRLKALGPDAYEVLREYQTDKGWVPVRIEMRRVGPAS
jgi:hypothetical protein